MNLLNHMLHWYIWTYLNCYVVSARTTWTTWLINKDFGGVAKALRSDFTFLRDGTSPFCGMGARRIPRRLWTLNLLGETYRFEEHPNARGFQGPCWLEVFNVAGRTQALSPPLKLLYEWGDPPRNIKLRNINLIIYLINCIFFIVFDEDFE